jgi:hypothetical protein
LVNPEVPRFRIFLFSDVLSSDAKVGSAFPVCQSCQNDAEEIMKTTTGEILFIEA